MSSTPTRKSPSISMLVGWRKPVHFAGCSGELVVKRGQLWITREGDPEDYVLDAGGRVVILPGEAVLVQSWKNDAPAEVAWRARGQSRMTAYAWRMAASCATLVAALADALAVGLRRAAHVVTAVGQRAAHAATPPKFIEPGPSAAPTR
jgi:hypothetical protein